MEFKYSVSACFFFSCPPAQHVYLLGLILQAHVMCGVCTAAGGSELAQSEMATSAAFYFRNEIIKANSGPK